MIDAKRIDDESLKRPDSITIVIEGKEDLTIIDNPPNSPTQEELAVWLGASARDNVTESQETKETATD